MIPHSLTPSIKERPILMSGAMVRATLADRKFQTRREMKKAPGYPGISKWVFELHPFAPSAFRDTPAEGVNIAPEKHVWSYEDWCGNLVGTYGGCPYGVVGDRLWVRETFLHDPDFHGEAATWYRASHDTFPGHWTPSIFMRRAYSRILLELSAVRVERLNDISEADAIAEGIESHVIVTSGRPNPPVWRDYSLKSFDPFEWFGSPIDSYRSLWESINGVGSWAKNPWVWVIEFKRVEAAR